MALAEEASRKGRYVMLNPTGRYIIIVLSVALMGSLEAQSFFTQPLSPKVKTLQVITDGDFQKLPVLDMDGNSVLSVSFDYLADEQPLIDYTLVHCNANWEQDDLNEMDYLEYNYLPQHIEKVAPSFNTFLQYNHFNVDFPNESIRPLLSGNYAMLFHKQDEPDSVLAVATFMVSEKIAFVHGEVSGNTDIDFMQSHQQVKLEVSWNERMMPNLEPAAELKLLVQQNRRRDSERWVSQPMRIQTGKAIYEHDRNLIFEAGNHWRRFQFSDERYPGLHVDHIRYHAPIYYAYLNVDKVRPNTGYLYDQDQHGHYLVHALHVNDMDTEAEYFCAMFSLEAPAALNRQGIYLMGDFTSQVIDSTTRMEFDADQGLYYKEVLLKEGVYNYQYLVPVDNKLTSAYTEGNHYETPNEYQIFIYHHPFGSRYDRLIGYGILK